MSTNEIKINTIKVRRILVQWLFNTIGMLMFWSGFFRPGFGADTVGQAYKPLINIDAAFQYGRYLTYALDIIAYRLGYRMDKQYKSTYLIFILMLALTVTIIQKIFSGFFFDSERGQHISGKSIISDADNWVYVFSLWSLSLLPIANVLFSEMYMFPENMIAYSLCYVTASLSAFYICKEQGKKGWVIGICLLATSCMFYQNGVIFAAILAVLYFYLDYWHNSLGNTTSEDNIISDREAIPAFGIYFYKSFSVAAAALVVGFINMKLQEFIQDTSFGKGVSKGHNFIGVYDNIKNLWYYLDTFFSTSLHMLPRIYIPLAALLLSDVIIVVILIRSRKNLQLVMALFTQIVMFGLACGIPLLMEEIEFAPRLIFILYEVLAAIAVMTIILIPQLNDQGLLGRGIRWSYSAFCILFVLIQMFFATQIAENHYLSNRQDLIFASLVHQKIQKYEKESGIRVNNIATVNDTVCTRYYDDIYYTWGQINERVIGMTTFSLLRYTTVDDHDFQQVKMDETVYNDYFKNRNWDEFDIDEQVIIIDDTLYWCVY